MKNVRCVFFDLDGVLLDAKEVHYEALNDALEEVSSCRISREDHLTIYDGLPTRIKLEKLSELGKIDKEQIAEIRRKKQESTIELIKKNISPVPFHKPLFEYLKEEKYKLGVCTNSVRETLDVSLDKLGLDKYFDVKLSNEDVDKPKPSPNIYLKSMELCQAVPQECLILEDNFNGIKAAIDSGAHLLKIEMIHEVNFLTVKFRLDELNE